MMRLDEVIRGIAITDRRGFFDADIKGITSDSRAVAPGELFVAVRGTEQDGHDFIAHALKQGATSVMGEAWPETADEVAKPSVVLVPNARRALALAAANFYGQPSRKLLVAGVTGTNGKTTVTYVLESIMRAASKKVGVIGTVSCRYAGQELDLSHTTPDAVTLQGTLRQMVDAGVSHAIMEVSSHALDQERVAGVHFKVAGFTNLTQDHLDYHADMESYFEAKALLFANSLRKSRARGRMAVVNVDDPRGSELSERWGGKTLAVSLDAKNDQADVVALETEYSLKGTKAKVRTAKGVWDLETSLVGEPNLTNVLVGVGMALAMGFSKQRILRGLRALERIPGRLDAVPNDKDKTVFVDYAHTPDALDRTLKAIRSLTKGRLIVVFGCGGDRDQAKRPAMGQAVARHAHMAVVTNDNPRGEEPAEIAKAVQAGLQDGGLKTSGSLSEGHFVQELDRRSAIKKALDAANAGDVVVIAGKGHENYQIVGGTKMRFDDLEEARCMLAGLPPPAPQVLDSVAPRADSVPYVDADQVEEALEVVEGEEIISEVIDQPSFAESIDAAEIVDEIDVEPIIEAEEAEDVGGPDPGGGPDTGKT